MMTCHANTEMHIGAFYELNAHTDLEKDRIISPKFSHSLVTQKITVLTLFFFQVIIRAEDWLPREVVKHLQRIEESILEWRAWVPESPVWDAISNGKN